MSKTFIQTFRPEGTEEEYDLVLETEDDDVEDNIRNRRPDTSSTGGPSTRGNFSLVPRGRRPSTRPTRPTERPVTQVQQTGQPVGNVQNHGDFIAIRKDAVTELLSLGGQLWAAYHVRPAMPQTTGDRDVDFTNASMHRDALAQHDQNRDRIRALSNLAERALRALIS